MRGLPCSVASSVGDFVLNGLQRSVAASGLGQGSGCFYFGLRGGTISVPEFQKQCQKSSFWVEGSRFVLCRSD